MFEVLHRSILWRIALAFVLGPLTYFLIEVVFSLKYRYYDIVSDPLSYLYAIIFAYLIIEGMRFSILYLDKRLSWDRNLRTKIILQVIISLITGFLFVNVVRLVILILFRKNVILLSDEVIIFVVTSLIILVVNFAAFALMLLKNWQFSQVQLERSQKESLEFQFETLRTQINPHFLFNSLNTLSGIVYADKDRAAEYIRRLSDVYRYVLEQRKKDLVMLREELKFIDAYNYLLQLRFEKKLIVNINIDEDKKNNHVAPMTLQLLVENAVKHNIISDKRPLRIDILNDQDYLVVQNNLQKKKTEANTSEIGLRNIRSRYSYITDKGIEIIESDKIFTVKVPFIQKDESSNN